MARSAAVHCRQVLMGKNHLLFPWSCAAATSPRTTANSQLESRRLDVLTPLTTSLNHHLRQQFPSDPSGDIGHLPSRERPAQAARAAAGPKPPPTPTNPTGAGEPQRLLEQFPRRAWKPYQFNIPELDPHVRANPRSARRPELRSRVELLLQNIMFAPFLHALPHRHHPQA